MKILITGANGFAGKNLAAALECIRSGKDRTHTINGISDLSELEICLYDTDSSPEDLDRFCAECGFVYNFAGVNRPDDSAEFMNVNHGFLSRLLGTLKKYGNTCPVVLSSSVQASLTGRYEDPEYGRSKLAAEELLFGYAEETGAKAYVYRFPNLFGKWCRPNYNSAVATFCNNIANDIPINISDRNTELELVYIDDLCEEMLLALNGQPHRCVYNGTEAEAKNDGKFCFVPVSYKASLGEIADLLYMFRDQPQTLIIPEIPQGSFVKKLFSAYLSYLPKEKAVFPLKMNSDTRGSFTELIKTGSCGQFSVNISKPGIAKGQHWHNSKWELFIVVSGHGLIRERRIDSDEVIEFDVSGDKLEAVYMLPGYTHEMINLSDKNELVTLMWANELFDESRPDTFSEQVSEISRSETNRKELCSELNSELKKNYPDSFGNDNIEPKTNRPDVKFKDNGKLKLLIIVGTRPEIIRLSAVIDKCRRYFDCILAHTGQNYDYNLNGIFFRDLKLGLPEVYMNAAGEDLGATIGNIIDLSYKLMAEIKPDALLILGDTNSCLSAIPAKRLHIPVFHMEAGNRCKDECLPEETNRRIVDIISDVNMAYSEYARRYLAECGLPAERTFVIGSPMAEVLRRNLSEIENSDIHSRLGLEKGRYILLSAHREENIDNEKNFFSLFGAINKLAGKYDMPILYSCHPRSRKRLEASGFRLDKRVIRHEPLGFHDYNCLQINAFAVVSDSGTLPEESSFFTSAGRPFPAVCIRTSTERPEALEKACFVLAGIDEKSLLRAVDTAVEMNRSGCFGIPVPDYTEENVSDKVVKLIQSYTSIVDRNVWRKF